MARTWLLASLIGTSRLAASGCQKDTAGADAKQIKALEDRIKALEAENAKNHDAMAFLQQAYAQQKAQQDEQDAKEPAPDAIFAVDITGDQVDGPDDALVTIVEAWDFA